MTARLNLERLLTELDELNEFWELCDPSTTLLDRAVDRKIAKVFHQLRRAISHCMECEGK